MRLCSDRVKNICIIEICGNFKLERINRNCEKILSYHFTVRLTGVKGTYLVESQAQSCLPLLTSNHGNF